MGLNRLKGNENRLRSQTCDNLCVVFIYGRERAVEGNGVTNSALVT